MPAADLTPGSLAHRFRTTYFPLFLMAACPVALIVFWAVAVHLDGSLGRLLTGEGLAIVLARWPWPTVLAAKIILGFALLEALLLQLLPGATFHGPITPAGNRPAYRLNGVLAFFVTHFLLYVASVQLRLFSPSIAYDNLGPILATLSSLSLVLCLLLYVKGSYLPSSSDAGRSGNFVWDYYWGVELHPRLWGMSLKQLANCRFGMMGWGVLLLSYCAKQQELYGHVSSSMLVSVGLQLLYILKFFYWEGGYFTSLDIMHDRLGFYIFWGVTCWVPGVYTLTALYLVTHPVSLPGWVAALLFALGALSIWVNYEADAQRQRVRESGGRARVWGRQAETLVAEYTTEGGERHQSLLLCSGYWGLARHFHYLPELMLALCWALPAGFSRYLPYFYVSFLAILLFDRAGRDERRCQKKYGPYWEAYRARVPWRIIPGVY